MARSSAVVKKSFLKKFPKSIAVIHLAPLPGSVAAADFSPWQALDIAGSKAIKEAQILKRLGFDALILENFGDMPFVKSEVSREALAALSVIAVAVREATGLPMGINVLRNDALSAMAVASVTGCDFIRVNVLSGVAWTDQGTIEGCASELLPYRQNLGSSVAIFADVHVKHAQSLSQPDLAMAIDETVQRSLADAIIITGSATGHAPDTEKLSLAQKSCKRLSVPFYIGSGSSDKNLTVLKSYTPHFIVSSDLRKGGKAGADLDQGRCKKWIAAYRKKRR